MKAWIIAAVVLLMSPMPALAQAQLTPADIQRLQDSVFDATADVSRLRAARSHGCAEALAARARRPARRSDLPQSEAAEESSAPRAEYSDLRDRIDRLRSQARGDAGARGVFRPPARRRSTNALSPTEIPVGTEFDVRLQSRLNSGTARVEDRFDATTIVPYERNGRMLVPAGSVMRGVVNSVTPASRGSAGKASSRWSSIVSRSTAVPIRFERP